MSRYIIGSLWDRFNRNGLNKNFEFLFEGREKIDELNNRASLILNEAQRTNDMNKDVQEQLDQLIIESGTSDAELVNARGSHSLLRDRLDFIDAERFSIYKETELNSDAITSIESANAKDDINLINYLGNKENIHPKVIHFENSWNGYKYWMAYTPYPSGSTDDENPCIAASNDKINWVSPADGINPLDGTPAAGWNSDTHLLHRADINQMEIWWREYNPDAKEAKIWRRITSDGKTWKTKELMFNPIDTPYDDLLSPAVLFEDGKYKIWYASGGGDRQIFYQESLDSTPTIWTEREVVNIEWGDLTAWHLDVISTEIGYEFITTCWKPGGDNNTADLYYHVTYKDGTNSKPKRILARSEDMTAIDYRGIYRSSIMLEDGKYYVFYSAIAEDYSRHMSISYGDSIYGLSGYSNHDLYRKPGNRTVSVSGGTVINDLDARYVDTVYVGSGGEVVVESIKEGYSGQKISFVLVSGGASLRIKGGQFLLTPRGEDVTLKASDNFIIEMICSSGHGVYWRPIYTRPSDPKVLRFDTPQTLTNVNVENIETIILQSTGTSNRYTLNSFSGAKTGQVLHVVTSGTPFIDVINSSSIRLPGAADMTLDMQNPGITLVFTSGTTARGMI